MSSQQSDSIPQVSAQVQETGVPLSTLHCYATIAAPLAAAFIALQVIVPTFYAESTGLSLTVIGLVLLAARLWDMVTDPIVGILSDRTPQRFGKRKIWVVVATPMIIIAVWKLFVPPPDVDWQYLLLWTVLIYIAGAMAIVPLNAWGAELSPVYHQRNRVAGARTAYGLAGTLIALLIAALAGDGGTDLTDSLLWVAVFVVITMFASVLLAAVKVPDRAVVELPENTLRQALKLLKTPGPIRQLLGSFFINSIANAVPATLFLLYVSYVIERPSMAGKLLFLYFILAAISVPVWIRIAKHTGKHQTWSGAMLLTCVVFSIVPFLSADTWYIYVVVVLISGFLTGADLILPVSIKGDLIEWDAYENGLRRPGLFFALWGTTTKLAFALAVGITFPILELAGFNTGTIGVSEGTTATGNNGTMALALMYCVPAILLKLTAIYLMRNYPITREEHERMSAEIASRNLS